MARDEPYGSGAVDSIDVVLRPLPAGYAESLDAMHRLAVYVISPAQRAANGEIVLRCTPGGFGTHPFGKRVVLVEGVDLVVDDDGTERRAPITSLAGAARLVGIEPDVAQAEQFDVPPPGDLDAPLVVDEASARSLAEWFAFVTDLLELFLTDAGDHVDASPVRLWPEHFDAAVDLGPERKRGTYGGSPGEAGRPEPYLYASPWAGRVDEFFDDARFRGASLSHPALAADPDPLGVGLRFLREARRRVMGA